MEIDRPEVVQEVRDAFAGYERALMANDVETLGLLFRRDPRTLRYGAGENLYGWDAIAGFRAGRATTDLQRRLENTVITTYGTDFATANTEFVRVESGKRGRQSQSWVRFPDEGWRIVAAHVSFLGQ
ncbi:oxalurate catabolism protein HpxZ [Roseomonas sp. NAR14]|uniref:Oxalurate catabolism protein HpxZ n=1 Tax=Roseomonas acroporae TaxID=2937791 RepID=A0A9X2BY54_9PROT|nr:oxalurate catabolism protein HpxZ [Roseomonas acroporae]MCK8786629.1 oxalurate catabolism protein HpxZ [Roseomonas acroporae]